jgi:hypothetical protein
MSRPANAYNSLLTGAGASEVDRDSPSRRGHRLGQLKKAVDAGHRPEVRDSSSEDFGAWNITQLRSGR